MNTEILQMLHPDCLNQLKFHALIWMQWWCNSETPLCVQYMQTSREAFVLHMHASSHLSWRHLAAQACPEPGTAKPI